MFRTTLIVAATALLAACSGPTNRIDMAQITSDLQLRALVSSAMVRTVSLPTYAASEEFAFETPEGFISSDSAILWADDPERAVTLLITRNMNGILNATIGPDPWPFVGLPDVSIEVRVSEMLAGADGIFRLRGQFFVGGDGIDFPNRARSFDIARPLVGEGLNAVPQAQAAALMELSETIARSIAR
ncbi:PqiC family protein [Yoonia sp. 208BN28-4]|uniref:PqiC family protein n=1 Tax=Yoonia sp. 208BN28-4 TaxID=3126505 RepID=UPI0030A1A455